jgi:MOB kinase activator 1
VLPEGEDLNEWLAVHGESLRLSYYTFIYHVSIQHSSHYPLLTAAVDFFNHLNMLYGTVTEFCTPQEVYNIAISMFHPFVLTSFYVLQCPVMSAGPRYEYLWEDGATYKRPTKLSAPDYVDALMNWVQGLLDDENIFPHKIGTHNSPLNMYMPPN